MQACRRLVLLRNGKGIDVKNEKETFVCEYSKSEDDKICLDCISKEICMKKEIIFHEKTYNKKYLNIINVLF